MNPRDPGQFLERSDAGHSIVFALLTGWPGGSQVLGLAFSHGFSLSDFFCPRSSLPTTRVPKPCARPAPAWPAKASSTLEFVSSWPGRLSIRVSRRGQASKQQHVRLADVRTVWVDLSVYQKDLIAVREGPGVLLSTSDALPDASGTIAYIGPLVGEDTRTAFARIVLPNSQGLWRPGFFLTARVAIDALSVPVRVPKTALQTIDGKTQVFIQHDKARCLGFSFYPPSTNGLPWRRNREMGQINPEGIRDERCTSIW